MDKDTAIGIFATAALIFVLGLVISGTVADADHSNKVWKQAVKRGYAEEVQTSKGTAYVWKELK